MYLKNPQGGREKIMKRLLGFFLVIFVCTPPVIAQERLDFCSPAVIVKGRSFANASIASWLGLRFDSKKRTISDSQTSLQLKNSDLVRVNTSTFSDIILLKVRTLCESFGYYCYYQNGRVYLVGKGLFGFFKPEPYIRLHFSSLRGRGSFGNFFFPISGGRKEFPVPRGWFWIYQKDKDHISSQWPKPYGGAKMPYSLFFFKGSAIHAGSLQIPSHACVHVRLKDAKKLFRMVKLYTLVYIS